MRTLIVIPTYNERENISNIVSAVLSLYLDVHILVVDDNSPDGTAKSVEEMMQSEQQRLHILNRPGRGGLGKAYIAGFKWGLEQGFELITEMDADFSHRPQDLAKVLAATKDNDFVIGSRWIKGGGTLNWGFHRKCISIGGSFYSRLILGYPINDWTGGFNAWRKPVLEAMNLDTIQSDGYSFQIELKYRASSNGFKGQEVPILFDERRAGQSKMSTKIVLEALYKVWLIRFQKLSLPSSSR